MNDSRGSRHHSSTLAVLLLFEIAHCVALIPTSFFPTLRAGRFYVMGGRRGLGRQQGLVMRDRSIVNAFKAGQKVIVVADVKTRGGSTAGLLGTVNDVWSKCMEDPICCCAENGMEEASISVSFKMTEEEASRFDQPSTGREFTSYFGVDELRVAGVEVDQKLPRSSGLQAGVVESGVTEVDFLQDS